MAENEATPTPRGTEALIIFTTKLPGKFHVPEDDLVVPSNLARYGLSEVINKLLDNDTIVPFDFLVDGQFLRTSIAQYLESRQISSEKALELEYVLALSDPEPSQVDQQPDWIASVTALGTFPTPWFAAVGYDGTVRVYEGTKSRLTTQLSGGPLTAVASLPTGSGKSGGDLLVMAGKDGLTRCCAVKRAADKVQLGPVAALSSVAANTRPQAVQAVAISEDGTLLANAGWDCKINLWNADSTFFEAPDASSGTKRKATGDAGIGRSPKFSMEGHSQVVTALQFGDKARFPFALFSGSWDGSIRVWDLAAASCVSNWTVARAVTSFSTSPAAPPQIATSHEDGHVSIWDVRAPPHPTLKGAVTLDVTSSLPLGSAQIPHRRLASQVAWCPSDATRLASVGHDGQLCILDPRSPKMPLQQLKLGPKGPCPTKLLCLCWLDKSSLAIGGSDGKVTRVSIANSADE